MKSQRIKDVLFVWACRVQVYAWAVAVLIAAAMSGCSGVPYVRAENMEARGVRDAGEPAAINAVDDALTVPVPAGSVVDVLPADVPDGQPSYRVTVSEATTLTATSNRRSASSGTVDTAIGMRRADNAARQPLLYAAIGCVLGAVVFVFLKYPGPAVLCGVAAVVCVGLWQMATLPAWLWAVALAAVAGAVGIYFAYERAEKDGKADKP